MKEMKAPAAGVENAEVIDALEHDLRRDEYVVVMVEGRPWDGSLLRLAQLQAKINTYLAFALEGQMANLYPQAMGKAVRFRLDCDEAPDAETAKFLAEARVKLREFGVAFEVSLR